MTHVYLIPHWFFGLDISLEIIFSIVSLAVCFFAYKTYKIAEDKRLKFLSISFLLIALSYLIWAGLNLFLLSNFNFEFKELHLDQVISLTFIFAFMQMALFTLGLATLAYATLDIQKGGRVYYLISGLALVALAASYDKFATFRIISIFLLAFIIYHYIIKCIELKNRNTKFILVAFILLLASSIGFLFSTRFYYTYIMGHLLELCAYTLILISLFSSVKHEQKKKQT